MTEKELWMFLLLVLILGFWGVQWLDDHFQEKEQSQEAKKVYPGEITEYADGHWHCEFCRDGFWHCGILDVSEDALKQGDQVEVRILDFDGIYILELA